MGAAHRGTVATITGAETGLEPQPPDPSLAGNPLAQLGERVPTRVSIVVAPGSAAVAWMIAVFAPEERGWAQIGLIILGTMLTVLAVGLPLLERWKANRAATSARELAARAQAQTRLAISDTLDPLANALGLLVDASRADKAARRGEAKGVILGAAVHLVSAERARACYYHLESRPRRRLVPDGFQGRAGEPTTTFEENTPQGDRALAILDQNRAVFIADLSAEPDLPPAPEYQTYIAVPVIAGDTTFGMVTVDAPQAGDLTDVDDLPLVRMLSGFLAIALRA